MSDARIVFVVPGNPQPWERAGSGSGFRRGPRTFYTPKRTRDYEARVAAFARRAGVRRIDGPVELTLHFYRGDARRCDLDNLEKSVKDGLNGIAWQDDSQVADGHKKKRIDRANPRAEIGIRAMDPKELEE